MQPGRHSAHSAPQRARTARAARRRGTVGLVIACIVVAACVVGVFAERWLLTTWNSLSADEIVFHLTQSIKGTNSDMVSYALLHYLLPACIVIAVIVAVIVLLRRHRAARNTVVCIALIASLASAGWALADLNRSTGLVTYLVQSISNGDQDFVAENYVDPASVQITFPEHKRNVVYIYLESLEMTFADKASGGAFDQNAIPNLTAIAQVSEDFSGADPQLDGAYALPGATWTMGAMFAQSTGLPLKTLVSVNDMGAQKDFFPGVTALGDILQSQGYRQRLLLGSDATFGGRRNFFEQHGGYEIHDYPYAKEVGLIPEDYRVFWGYEDEKLFEYAKTELLDLASGDQPFNLTILTVDTHFEDGYVCELCGDEFGDNQYANVFACSDRQVAAFVQWIQQQDFYQDTVIVLCGDHLTMDTDFKDDVPQDYGQRTYTAIINSAAITADPTRTRTYTTYDLFPTTLAALGATIQGDRLGIGTNLYSSTDTLAEELGVNRLGSRLTGPSKLLAQLGAIVLDDAALDNALRAAELTAVDDGEGGLAVELSHILVNYQQITDATLVVTDTRTGEELRTQMLMHPEEKDTEHNSCCEATVPYTSEDLPHLSFTILLSTADCTDHAFTAVPNAE